MMKTQLLFALPILGLGIACAQSPDSTPAKAPECPKVEDENLPAPGPTDTMSGARITGEIATVPPHAIKNGGVVYLEDGPKQPGVGLTTSVDNRDMTFTPFISIITMGGSVTFTNSDPLLHNVFSPDNEKWDIGNLVQNGSTTKPFEKPGTYVLLCNRHQNMIGYLVVSPSSYFGRATRTGKFAIGGVPPGTYKVTAWAPRLKPQTQSITVGATGDTVASFKLTERVE